jgi:hypothetical protein
MSERPLTIVSLNVRGLGRDSTKQKLIKTWLSSLQIPPQILFIQEHHLDEQGATNSTKGMEFWQGGAFWNLGIPMGNSQRISAGTAILVDRMTAPLVKEDGIITEGRTQYLTLHLPDSTELPSSTPMHRGHPETKPLCGKKSGRPTSQQTMSSLEVTSTTWKRGCTEERQPPGTT